MYLKRGMDPENMVHLHMEYYAAIKNNEFLKFLHKWIDLEDIILSEVTESPKNSLISGY
jgi:CRISPR/Cas system endoribonuclease Cas6 (RAMP superfamily)